MSDNELIAEFMGYYLSGKKTPSGYDIWLHDEKVIEFTINEFQYDVRWDWLIPVVPVFKEKTKHTEMPHHLFMNVVAFTVDRPIHELYENIVKGIKWFNQQNNADHSKD